jgi:aspartate racemase
MAGHVGIVACSAEGAALCYKTLCAEGEQHFGPHGHPEVTLSSLPLSRYVACLDRGDWPGVAALMLESAGKLAKAGADFLICPDNTIHQALPWVTPRSSLPWLHIAEVVAADAARQGMRRLALTGTRWLVASEVYPDALGKHHIECIRPLDDECAEVNRIIMEELVRGVFKPPSIAYCQRVIGRMKGAGCDGVILGCTELPLILGPSNSDLPTLDSTRLLARAALVRAASL